MNPNEFADELEKAPTLWFKDEIAGKWIIEKLRQQQAEIEALKQNIDANNLNQNIGQFVKPANEPVAWMTDEGVFEYYPDQRLYVNKQKVVPLYTHPAKTLTDEEIKEMYNEHCVEGKHGFDYFKWLDFSRAILKKAQEK